MMTNRYNIFLEIEEQEINDIFREIREAEHKIWSAYQKLADMNLLKIRKASNQESLDDDQSPK